MTKMKKIGYILFAFLLAGTAASFAAKDSGDAASEKAKNEASAVDEKPQEQKLVIAASHCPGWGDPFPGHVFRRHHRMMRMMDDLFNDAFAAYPARQCRTLRGTLPMPQTDAFFPNCDIKETKGAYIFSIEVPGIPKESIKISVEDNILSISGEKMEAKDEDVENFHAAERVYGSFSRAFTLPDGTNTDKIKAECKDGLLTVTIPKAEEKKPEAKTIKID